MKIEIPRLRTDLEYSEVVTITLIEQTDLASIYGDEFKPSYHIFRALAKQDQLKEETKETLKGIFDNIILTREDYISKYIRIAKGDVIVEEPIKLEEQSKAVVHKTVAPKKERALPRRFGKVEINKYIKEKQNGIPTNVQTAALACNDLKNIFVNVNNRLINDMLADRKILVDEDYRKITATIRTLHNQLKPILKKK